MTETVLRGHRVAKGKAQGEALVSYKPISFTGGVDVQTGVITDKASDIVGISIAGKILVFPVGKGSTLGSYRLLELVRCKAQPKGIINLRADPIIAMGAIISNIPMIDKLDRNPLELIRTGDFVELDADEEVVRVGT
jgi:predicted aconitase with swiveling domain